LIARRGAAPSRGLAATLRPLMAEADTPEEESLCPPCRGTGSVISRLGGEERKVKCPWCDGTGRRRPLGEAREAIDDPSSP
jgi:hypothetical protein